MPPDPDTLKSNPMESDPTSLHAGSTHVSPHRHFMGSDTPTEYLFAVPILYSLDRHEIKDGHVTKIVPTDNSRTHAWEKGPKSNFPQIVTMWKKTNISKVMKKTH